MRLGIVLFSSPLWVFAWGNMASAAYNKNIYSEKNQSKCVLRNYWFFSVASIFAWYVGLCFFISHNYNKSMKPYCYLGLLSAHHNAWPGGPPCGLADI